MWCIRSITANDRIQLFSGIAIILLIAGLPWCAAALTLPDATRRVVVFSDQINDAPGSGNFQFAATHYAGMQKVDKGRIDAYRAINPSFLVVQYHKSYGVDLGGNITSAAPPYWNNDIDTFNAWVGRHANFGSREGYYLHYDDVNDSAHRIQHFFANTHEYDLMDPSHPEYARMSPTKRPAGAGTSDSMGPFLMSPMFPCLIISRGLGALGWKDPAVSDRCGAR